MSNPSDFVIRNGELEKYVGPGGDVVVPEGVTGISWNAFANCENLTSISLPEGLTNIRRYAFFNCKNLTRVTMWEGTTEFGEKAFGGCKRLADGAGFVIVNGVLSDYLGPGGDMIVPKGVISIAEEAFRDCEDLKSITLPEGVKSVGMWAFEDCKNLTSVTLSKGLITIGWGAFKNCENIQSIVLPEGLATLEEEAFESCSRLTDITLPASLESIGKNAFMGCGEIEEHGNYLHTRLRLGKTVTAQLSFLYKGDPVDAAYLIVNHSGSAGKAWLKVVAERCDLQQADIVLQEIVNLIERQKKLKNSVGNQIIQFMQMTVYTASPKVLKTLYEHLMEKGIDISSLKEDKVFQEIINASSPDSEKNTAKEENSIEKYVQERFELTGDTVNILQLLSGTSVAYKDHSAVCSSMVTAFLIYEYTRQLDSGLDFVVSEDADQVAAALDRENLHAVLGDLVWQKGGEYMIPYCRYADGKGISDLLTAVKKKEIKVSSGQKRKDPKAPVDWKEIKYAASGKKMKDILESCLMLSDTREAVAWLEKNGDLKRYAEIRGLTKEEVYEQLLYDFGFDENGKRIFDLGVTTIEVTLTKDMGVALWNTSTGKATKIIPKKDVAPDVQKKAADELSDMRRNIKKAMKIKTDQLFADYIDGRECPADRWKKDNLHNPFLRGVASLLVWNQEDATFILTDNGAIDGTGQLYTITDAPIRVAHPMEMKAADVESWQKYFTAHGLKQPFSQVWEPVYQSSDVREDRYDQSKIRLMYLRHQEKRGIELEWWGDNWYYGDRKLEIKGFDVRYEETEDEDDNGPHLIITSLRPQQWNRRANTVIAFLDRITVRGRIRKDDVTVMDHISAFTLAQITEFIAIAQEANAFNVLALLLEYKKDHFAGFDPMEEYTLDL